MDHSQTLFWVLLILYFLPTIVGRGQKNIGSIFTLNLLLGWTFIGWVIAMVWAVKVNTQPTVIYTQGPPRDSLPQNRK
jgi:hypothetical protein